MFFILSMGMGRLELPILTEYDSEPYAYTNSATCPIDAFYVKTDRTSSKGYTPFMESPFWFRYAANRIFWSFAAPMRKMYRYLFRPTLRGVKVVIFNKDSVLLVRPNYAHRLWTFPGGSVESHETYEEAAIREAEEETGLKIGPLSFIREYETIHDSTKNISRAFVTHTNADEVRVDGIEIKEAGWFPLNALPEDRVPRVDVTLEVYRTREM